MRDILIDTADAVMTLSFQRVEKKNSITRAMYGALADALMRASEDPAVRVLLIQGDPSVFSAGNDMVDFLNAPPANTPADEPPVWRFLRAIASFPKPLLAAVSGPAVGIGTTMLLHCDLVYAGDNAAFSLPFVNLGLCPEAASSLLLPQFFGYHKATELLLLAEPFSAQDAQAAGLVSRVLPAAECNAYALKQAHKLAAKPLSALVETKRLLKSAQSAAVLARMQLEGESFNRMIHEPAAREALTAFAQKRKPDFSKL